MKRSMLVLIGAVAGGLVGYFGFLWIARQGFYALVLPGGLLGVGASLFPNRSTALCIVCGLLALARVAVCAIHPRREPWLFRYPHPPTQANHAHYDRGRGVHWLLGTVQASST
jgi:hypothetical protein